MKNKRFQFLMLILYACIVFLIHFFLNSTHSNADIFGFESSLHEDRDKSQWDFPALHITSEANPFLMERLTWYDGIISFPCESQHLAAQLRGRGTSTWSGAPEKRPLRIRFHEPQFVFGFESPHRDWILLANALDPSLLRNYFAFILADLMGNTCFVTSSQFVHLYINGDYVGVYQLTDERDIDIGRLALQMHPNPTVSEYLLEMNARTGDIEVNERKYRIRFPSGTNQTQNHTEYVSQYLHSVSEAILSGDWSAVKKLIDIPSLVDYYIIHELTKDVDVGFASKFMQIKGQDNERRLYLGPVWDFDLSLGLFLSYHHIAGFDNSPEGLWAAVMNYWFKHLMHIPEFQMEVMVRWSEIVEHEIPLAIEKILRVATTYQNDFERNFVYHSILVHPGLHLGAGEDFLTFMEHVTFIIDFVIDRTIWLDEYFTSLQ